MKTFKNRNSAIDELEKEYPGFGFKKHYAGYLRIKESNKLRDNENNVESDVVKWKLPNPNVVNGYINAVGRQ